MLKICEKELNFKYTKLKQRLNPPQDINKQKIVSNKMNLKLDIDPHAVCRICLSQKSLTNNLFNYFSNTVVEGYIISVPDMVMKCLDIEVKIFVLVFRLFSGAQNFFFY